MRFASPWFLLLFLLLPLLWQLRYRRRGNCLRFSSADTLEGLPKSWRIRMQPVFPVLYLTGLCCCIIAAARPQRGIDESVVRTEGVDMVMLTDVSGSMKEADFVRDGRRITRMEASKEVIAEFVEARKDDRLGMVVFAAMPYSLAPLTLDHGWLVQRMDWVQAGMLDRKVSATAIGDGIAAAVNRLRDSKAKSRVIILLTDGANNHGDLSPENAAQAAKALGIKIYTIGIGAPYREGFFGMRIPVQLDEQSLTDIADSTGGKYFRAMDMESLKNVYHEIDQLEKTEIEMHQYTRYRELFMHWLTAGLILLTAETVLRLTRLGRLPL